MNTPPIRCTNCDGRGRIRQFICDSAYPAPNGIRPAIFFSVTCPYCSGNGFLRPGSKKAKKAAKR